MHIKGGLNGQRGNPIDGSDEGVFVSKINSSGAARRDGRLKVLLLFKINYNFHIWCSLFVIFHLIIYFRLV